MCAPVGFHDNRTPTQRGWGGYVGPTKKPSSDLNWHWLVIIKDPYISLHSWLQPVFTGSSHSRYDAISSCIHGSRTLEFHTRKCQIGCNCLFFKCAAAMWAAAAGKPVFRAFASPCYPGGFAPHPSTNIQTLRNRKR